MRISILVASFGDQQWDLLARRRALPSTEGQAAHEVVRIHDPEATLAQVRNRCAEEASGTHLLFVDADDELQPRFCEEIAAAGAGTTRTLLTPSVQYVRGTTRKQAPKIWPEMEITKGNWMIIGTVVPRDLFLRVGGFREYEWSEDWALWAMCLEAGADVIKVPSAVYTAYVQMRSRNRNKPRATVLYWHERIGHDIWPHLYEPPTAEEDERRMLATNHVRFV